MLYFKVFFVLKYIKIIYFLIFKINFQHKHNETIPLYIFLFFFYFRCHFATRETKSIIFG